MKNREQNSFWRCGALMTGCNALWFFMLCGITVIALGSMVSKAFFAVLLLPFLLYGIWFLFHKKLLLPRNFPYGIAWWILCLAATLFMFWFAYSARVESLSWDWGRIIRTAGKYVLTGHMKDNVYYARYPNNQFWYMVMVVLFKIVHWFNPAAGQREFYLVSIAFGCLVVTGAIILLHMTANILWGAKKAFAAGCIAYLCLPLYMWALYAYTDTSGMLLLMFLLFLYVKAEKTEKLWQYTVYMGLIGLTGAIAWKVKVTVFIFVIAVFLVLLMKKVCGKKLLAGLLALALFFTLGKITADAGVSQVLALDEKFYDQHEFPLTHWIMMSLGYGGYRKEDVVFTSGFPTYKEKQEANVREIKRRLQEKGLPGSMRFFFYNKQVRTWGDSTFGGCDYLSREPVYPDGFLARFVTMEGDMNWLLLFYTSLYYGMLLAGMILSAYYGWKQRNDKEDFLFVGRLTMVGIAVFLTIWECNARYLVVFLPLMILLSCDGYMGWRERLGENGKGMA